MKGIIVAAAMVSLVPAAVQAQPTPPPAPAASTAMLDKRAAELIAIFNGAGDVAQTFAPEFLAQIPEDARPVFEASGTVAIQGKASRPSRPT